jgi:putative ABC transport system ATP-binding protein
VTEILVGAMDVGMIYGRGRAAVRALDDVSLELRRGETLLIVGPSGSGKTTLLQILGALIRPTSGSVVVDGRAIDNLSAKARGRLRLAFFGFVFQAYHLIPTLRAWENVAITLDLKGVRGRAGEAHSRALLDQVGISHRADAFPAQLSGGEQQRVAVARAIALDPEVILADEPTASLDRAAGRAVIELLRGLALRQRRAVAIVTHDSRFRSAGDRILTLDDGRLARAQGFDMA